MGSGGAAPRVAMTAAPAGSADMGRRWRHFDKSAWLWLLAIAVLLFLVVNPLFRLVAVSFESPDGGGLTVANYVAAYSRSRYLGALGNSLVLGLAAATMCLLFGAPLASAVSR